MRRSGRVTITALPGGRHDIHIGPAWRGRVAVSLPLKNRKDAIIHMIAGTWVPEGKRGQRTIWVDQLSPFSTIAALVHRVGAELCLSRDPWRFLRCLGRDFLGSELASGWHRK